MTERGIMPSGTSNEQAASLSAQPDSLQVMAQTLGQQFAEFAQTAWYHFTCTVQCERFCIVARPELPFEARVAILAVQLQGFEELLEQKYCLSRRHLSEFFTRLVLRICGHAMPDSPHAAVLDALERYRAPLDVLSVQWPDTFAALVSANPKDPEFVLNLHFFYEEILASARDIARNGLAGTIVPARRSVVLF